VGNAHGSESNHDSDPERVEQERGNYGANPRQPHGSRDFLNQEPREPRLKKYIAGQKEHHRKQSFQEELVQILDEYGIEYDERYLWN
jgi:hypothetical protein